MGEDHQYETVTLEEYEPQFWSCQNCFCGLCLESCPAYRELKNEAVSARGLAQIGIALLNGEIDLSEVSDDLLYACVGCRWCETVCSMNTPLYIQRHGTRRTKVSGATMAEILRSIKIMQSGKIPSELRSALMGIIKYGNPYGFLEKVKDDWVAGLGLQWEGQDTLLYAGSTVPYDDHSRKMAEAIAHILTAVGLDFAMLGSEEKESGAFARMFGEEGLFQLMVEHNIGVFRERNIKRVICVSPHDYDTFRHYYDGIKTMEVRHYTQIIWEMMERSEIKLSKSLDKKIVYHDPCYLGRQNDVYEEPRKILHKIPGVDLLEMKKSGETALCCGGGGTGLFIDLPNVNIDKARADQIAEVGAECVVVACPNCYQMLDGAIKSRGYDIEVKDIAQVVMEAI